MRNRREDAGKKRSKKRGRRNCNEGDRPNPHGFPGKIRDSEAVRDTWSPMVRPPRLGGNKRVGVFATRSPFRPNPIGLSSVKLEYVEQHPSLGPVLHLTGADLMDGTPILDIKSAGAGSASIVSEQRRTRLRTFLCGNGNQIPGKGRGTACCGSRNVRKK